MKTMQAYHGKPELKKMMVEEARLHREADQLAQSFGYGKTVEGEFKGCAVGCTIHSLNRRLGKRISYDSHAAYETELGVPKILARLEDGIFENLPKDDAMTWPQQFLEAIPPGADLSQVSWQFLHWLLVDPKDGVIKYAKKESQKQTIKAVGDLYERKLKGEVIELDDWVKARKKAAAAYAAAAYAADADAAADYAAAAAAYAYAYAAAAAYAADAADYAAAAAADAADAAARYTARKRQAEKLLELMAAAPVLQAAA